MSYKEPQSSISTPHNMYVYHPKGDVGNGRDCVCVTVDLVYSVFLDSLWNNGFTLLYFQNSINFYLFFVMICILSISRKILSLCQTISLAITVQTSLYAVLEPFFSLVKSLSWRKLRRQVSFLEGATSITFMCIENKVGQTFECLTANAKVATALGSIPASSDTLEFGRVADETVWNIVKREGKNFPFLWS